ncbi:MAG TPA: hypothetical protein VF376_12145 [Thermoanaerobaculia bacterium]
MDIEQEFRDPRLLSARLAFHGKVIAEEEAAEAICDRVLRGPSRWWRNALFQEEGFRTAGMVAILFQRMDEPLQKSLPDALVLSELAIEVANAIETDEYPYDHVQKIRGQALREHAYVLTCIGRHREAGRIADLAGVFLKQIPIPDPELARLDLVRSNIARVGEDYDAAIAFARRAGETFLRFGSRSSWLKALDYEGAAYFMAGNPGRGLEVWGSMKAYERLLTREHRAAWFHNMGLCAGATGKFDEAARCYARAAAEFDRLGLTVNRVKSDYAIGLAMIASARHEDAAAVLEKTAGQFSALGLESDAALAALARAEALLAIGRAGEVPAISRDLIERFTRAGIKGAAMTALAYLRESLAIGHATPESVRHIHDFLRDTNMGSTRAFVPHSGSSVMVVAERLDV